MLFIGSAMLSSTIASVKLSSAFLASKAVQTITIVKLPAVGMM